MDSGESPKRGFVSEQKVCAPDNASISPQLGYLVGHAVMITASKIQSLF
ncbi:hypothetical protein OAE21_00495 [Rubripirellula sp.]|nr:hypothetical protein [Rubripirellula sp.]MDB4624528.1 hypothetical protein [Rubripirellula sp.]